MMQARKYIFIAVATITQWPKPLQWSILLIAICLLGSLAYQWDFRYLLHKKYQAQQTEAALKIKLAQQQQTAAQLNYYRQQLQNMQQLDQQWQTQPKLAELLDKISQLGTANELKFVSLHPGNASQQDFYCVKPLHITVSGTFVHIANFIYALTELPDLITLSDFKLVPSETPQNTLDPILLFNFVVDLYYLDPGSTQLEHEQ